MRVNKNFVVGDIFSRTWGSLTVRRRVLANDMVNGLVMEVIDGPCVGRVVTLDEQEARVYACIATKVGRGA